MSTVAFIRRCLAAGMDLDTALLAADAFEATPALPSAGSLRTAKWRANRTSQSVTVTDGDACDGGDAAPLSRPLSPQTPLTPTQSPGDINTCARPVAAKPNGFARFWEAYPNKVSKLAAEKAYIRALGKVSGPDPPAVLLAGVERAKASRQWVEGYVPHPTTWLNGGGWDDQPAEVITLNPTRQAHDRPDHKLAAKHANFARAFEGSERAAGRDWKP